MPGNPRQLFDYGGKVKAIDPNAILLAPEEWGWPGYLTAALDWQWAGANNDYNPRISRPSTNGGWDTDRGCSIKHGNTN